MQDILLCCLICDLFFKIVLLSNIQFSERSAVFKPEKLDKPKCDVPSVSKCIAYKVDASAVCSTLYAE